MRLLEVSMGAALALLATSLGAGLIFAFKRISDSGYAAMLAFCAGIMTFSALEMLGQAHVSVSDFEVVAGFGIGLLVLLISDHMLPHVHAKLRGREISASKKKAALITGAITIHNLPEGFAIASAFAGSAPLGWLVAISIALQDIPEGFIISGPLSTYGVEKNRSLWFGILSGIVEASAAIAGYIFLAFVSSITPLALAFSAGAMFYVVFAELLPDAFRNGQERVAALSFAAGAAVAFGVAALLAF